MFGKLTPGRMSPDSKSTEVFDQPSEAGEEVYPQRFRSYISVSASNVPGGGDFTQNLAGLTPLETASRRGSIGDPLGLVPVNTSPVQHPDGDIIFVHGLGDTSQMTWSYERDPDYFWLPWLSSEPELSRFRIFTFGYNASWKGSGTVVSITDFAKDLLLRMLTHATGFNQQSQPIGTYPIMFVAHSIGGLVVKKAYIIGKNDNQYREMISRVFGMVFLATPHRGANNVKLLNTLLSTYPLSSSRIFISELERNSSLLQDINDQFRTVCEELKLVSFYETRKTYLRVGDGRILVEKESAILRYPQEKTSQLDADHHGMCKFKSPDDPKYILVRNMLKWLAASIKPERDYPQPQRANTLAMVEHLEGVLGIQADPQKDLLSIQSKSTPGSCEWISRRADFIQWAQKEESDQSPRMFYLVGLPATGKTVVTSYVVSFLQSKFQQNSCQYHFFPSGDRIKHTGAYILRSIAFQIAKVNSVFRSKLFELYETESVAFEHQKLLIIWEKIFQGILFKMDVGVPLFWVLDAFDEINSSDLLLRLFNKFRSKILIKIFVVSRPSANLPQMTMSTKDTLGDIRTYVERTVQDTLMVDDQVQKEIVDKVLKATNGSFLWVSLCLEELRMCHTQDDIQNAITDMLPGMESMYSRMIHSVAEQPVRSRKLAARILTWTVYSYRPLHVLELRAALELEFGSFINLEATIAQICGHLVTVHHSEVTPLHETVRVFLHENLSTLSTSGPQGHEYLALTCIQYLSNDRWGNLFTKAPDGLSRTRGTKEERHRQVASLEDAHPFFSYAASNWAFHVSKSNPCSDEVLSALANLGLLYRDQGKLAEAEQMFLRALAGKEKALGPDHPSTLDTVDNLGLLYRDQGKLAEAEQIYRRALAGREKALGLDHTSTLDTVNDLGTLYRAQGKLIEAEQMYRRALAGGKKAWGPDHTSTLDTVNNLGSLYAVQEQLTKTLASLPSDSGYQSATLPPNQEYVERQHSPQRSAIESGVVGNHDSFKPVEDTMSVPSADDEIASQRTMQRTQEARTGEYEIMQVMLANEELVAVVTDVLASVGREKFIRNFRRQLKRYYLELEHSVTLEPQKLAISLLRRRAARLWIATTLADRLGPEEENAFNWERLDVEHIDMRKRLNEWLYERYESTNFSTLHQNLSAEESGLGTVDISSNNRPSSTEDSSSEISDGESEDEKLKMQAPDLMEKLVPLFTTGPSFRLLLANTQLLKLPRSLSSLTRILMTIPTHDISYLDNFRQSYSDRLKRSVEGLCGYEWNWWPLQQPQPRLAKGYVRIRWRCHCGSQLWADVAPWQATIYQSLLRERGKDLNREHLCLGRSFLPGTPTTAILHSFKSPSLRTHQDESNQAPPSDSSDSFIESNQSEQNQVENVSRQRLSNQSQTRQQPRYVVFGVVEARQPSKVATIPCGEQTNDGELFRDLKRKYRDKRACWRRWLSIWQLDHCDFVKFLEFEQHWVSCEGQGLPHNDPLHSDDYEYSPRNPLPPPPISVHEWRLALQRCDSVCLRSFIHRCTKPSVERTAIERIPKRKTEWKGKRATDKPQPAWGLRARHCVSASRVGFYVILLCLPLMVFWFTWQANHPTDPTTSSTPVMVLIALLTLFVTIPASYGFQNADEVVGYI